MVEYEESLIKCYARKDKQGEIKGYQRRVLLSDKGKLGGCPEPEDPRPVVVLYKDDFLELKKMFDTYQEAEKDQLQEVHDLKEKVKEYKEELEGKEQDIRQAIGFIGVAWAGIQDLKGRSWWDRLRGNIPESLMQLHKPPGDLLPLPEDAPITLEDTAQEDL